MFPAYFCPAANNLAVCLTPSLFQTNSFQTLEVRVAGMQQNLMRMMRMDFLLRRMMPIASALHHATKRAH